MDSFPFVARAGKWAELIPFYASFVTGAGVQLVHASWPGLPRARTARALAMTAPSKFVIARRGRRSNPVHCTKDAATTGFRLRPESQDVISSAQPSARPFRLACFTVRCRLLSRIRSEFMALYVSNANVRPGFTVMQRSLHTLQPSTSALQPSLHPLQASTSALQPPLHALQASTSTLQASLHALQASTSALQPSLHALQASASALQPSLHALQASTSALQPSLHALQPSTSALQPSLQSLQTSTSVLQL